MRVLKFSLCVAALLSVSGGAWAQSSDVRPLYDRIDRLERDIQTLQSQLARGNSSLVVTSPSAQSAGTGAGGNGGVISAGAAGLSDRVDNLEQQIQDLTGKVEEANHKAMLNAKQLERLQADIDLRFKELQPQAQPQTTGDNQPAGQAVGQPGGQTQSASMPGVTPAPSKGQPAPPDNSAGSSGLAPGPQVLGKISPKDVKKGVETPPDDEADVATAAPANTPKTPKAAYDAAYAMYQARDYAGATQAFKAFAAKYPEHQLVPSAVFWQGEAAFAQGDYKSAASIFGEGYRKYPSSTKAPDLLYKLGKSFAQLNMTKEACRAFKLLGENHPDMPDRLRKASAADREKLGCK